MVVNRGRRGMDASEIAAESPKFARKWGGQLVREWGWDWIKHCKLPELNHGWNVKVFTLFSDPTVCEELQNYVWSNKWSKICTSNQFHSPLLVVGCIMKDSITCNIGKQYISMGTIDLMFWITSRGISYLPCKNTDFEWLNTKLARLR